MEYTPQDSLETRKQQYLDLLSGYSEAKGIPYDVLKDDCYLYPEAGRRMNDYVLEKAQGLNISGEVLTGIIAASPLIQQMMDDKLPVAGVLQELIESTRAQYAKELQQTQTPIVQNAIASAYSVLKSAESAVFSITPLPLQGIKGLVQNVAAPMVIAALGTRIPGVDQAISTTMSLASSFTSTAFAAVAGNAVAYFGHAAMGSMPSSVAASLTAELPNFHWLGGMAGQSIASVSNAVSQAVVTVAAAKVGQLTGAVGSAVLIGNTAIAIGRQVSYEVSTKGIKTISSEVQQSMSSLFTKSNQILAKAEQFIESVKEKISGVTMNQENLSVAQQQYMDLVKDHPVVGSMSYAEISEAHAKSQDYSKINDYVADSAFKAGKSPEEIRDIISASPMIDFDLKNGRVEQNTVNSYLNQFEHYYSQEQVKAQVNDKTSSLLSGVEASSNHVTQNGETQPKQSEPEKPKPVIIEPEQTETVKSTQDKTAEAYALSTLNTVFSARGIEIKNAQIDFNGQTVFKLKNNSLDKSEMTNEAQDAIQKALTDPANLKGEVKISVGGKMLLHVKNGEVLAGHAFIKESVKVEVATPGKQRYDELASTVRATGYEKTKQIAVAAYGAGESTADIKTMLSNHDEAYQKHAESAPTLNDAMLIQAQSRSLSPVEGKSQEKTKERTPDMAIVA
jgi:hypothetical protein